MLFIIQSTIHQKSISLSIVMGFPNANDFHGIGFGKVLEIFLKEFVQTLLTKTKPILCYLKQGNV